MLKISQTFFSETTTCSQTTYIYGPIAYGRGAEQLRVRFIFAASCLVFVDIMRMRRVGSTSRVLSSICNVRELCSNGARLTMEQH